jgi:hypothetical protein
MVSSDLAKAPTGWPPVSIRYSRRVSKLGQLGDSIVRDADKCTGPATALGAFIAACVFLPRNNRLILRDIILLVCAGQVWPGQFWIELVRVRGFRHCTTIRRYGIAGGNQLVMGHCEEAQPYGLVASLHNQMSVIVICQCEVGHPGHNRPYLLLVRSNLCIRVCAFALAMAQVCPVGKTFRGAAAARRGLEGLDRVTVHLLKGRHLETDILSRREPVANATTRRTNALVLAGVAGKAVWKDRTTSLPSIGSPKASLVLRG